MAHTLSAMCPWSDLMRTGTRLPALGESRFVGGRGYGRLMPRRHRIVTVDDWHQVTYETPWKHSLSFLVLPIIAGQPYLYHTESDLHRAITEALTAARVPFRHEVSLGPGARIDFVSRGVGVEIKIAGQADDVSKQLRRYHATGKLKGLVLLTTCGSHLQIPERGLGGLTAMIHLWAAISLLPRARPSRP